MQYATCPECHLPQEVVDDGSGQRWRVFRRHGTVDLNLCPGSEQTPPAPARAPGGWRVQIHSREHGILQAPLRIGPYDEAQADADERWLRHGRYRDSHWPSIAPSAKRWIVCLSPEDVRHEIEIQAGQLQLAREMDAIHEDLARERTP